MTTKTTTRERYIVEDADQYGAVIKDTRTGKYICGGRDGGILDYSDRYQAQRVADTFNNEDEDEY